MIRLDMKGGGVRQLRFKRARIETLDRRLFLDAVVWDGGGNGVSWTDPLNWSGDALPGANDDVLIPTTTGAGVTLSFQNASVRSLTLGDGVNAARLTISSQLAVLAPTSVRSGALLRLLASASITGFHGVENEGQIELLSGSIPGPMNNSGSVLAQHGSIGRYVGTAESILRLEATTGLGSTAGLFASGGIDTAGDIILTNIANSLGTNAAATLNSFNGPLTVREGGSIRTIAGQFVPGRYTITSVGAQIDVPVNVAATTELRLDGTGDWNGAGVVENFGTLTLPFGAFYMPIDNAGTLLCKQNGVQVLGPFNSRVGSLIRIEAGMNQANVTASFYNGLVNRGTIELDSIFAKVPTLSVANQVLTNESTGTIIALTNGGGFPPGTIPPDRIIQGSVLNRGLMTMATAAQGELANQLRVSSVVVNEGVVLVSDSTKFYSGFSPMELRNGGRLSGSGTLIGSVRNISGVVEPGDVGVISTLQIEGNYIQESGGTYTHDFRSGSRDQLTVTGAVTVGGTLTWRALQPTVDPVSDRPIITGASVAGAFETIPSIVQSNGVILGTRTNATAVLQTASPRRPALPDLPASLDSGASNSDNITINTQLQIIGIAEQASMFELYRNNILIGSGPVSSHAYGIAIELAEGTHVLRTRSADADGDWSDFSNPLQITVDITPPAQTGSAFAFENAQIMTWEFNEAMPLAALPQVVDAATGVAMASSSILAVAPASPNRTSFRIAPGVPDGDYIATPSVATNDLAGNAAIQLAPLQFFILAGDANRDRRVDISDFAILAARFNLPGTFSQGDFNYDGVTNVGDFSILASKFNSSLSPPMLQRSVSQTAMFPTDRREIRESSEWFDLINH